MAIPPAVNRPVGTIERAIEIMEYLKEHDTATVSEMTAHLDCAKSTTHRYMKNSRDPSPSTSNVRNKSCFSSGRWKTNEGIRLPRDVCPANSRKNTGASLVSVAVHGRSVHIYERSGGTLGADGRPSWPSERSPPHAAAKAIRHTFRQPDHEDHRQAWLAWPDATTITDRDELWEEIEAIRDRGYAFNFQESVEGLHAVGAPITDENDIAIGASRSLARTAPHRSSGRTACRPLRRYGHRRSALGCGCAASSRRTVAAVSKRRCVSIVRTLNGVVEESIARARAIRVRGPRRTRRYPRPCLATRTVGRTAPPRTRCPVRGLSARRPTAFFANSSAAGLFSAIDDAMSSAAHRRSRQRELRRRGRYRHLRASISRQ